MEARVGTREADSTPVSNELGRTKMVKRTRGICWNAFMGEQDYPQVLQGREDNQTQMKLITD